MLGFPFMADSDKKVSLTGCQLIKHIFIGLFVLVDDLCNSCINIMGTNMVLCCKKLVEHFLQIPGRSVKTLIDSTHDSIVNLFSSLFKMLFRKDFVFWQWHRFQEHY